MSKNQIHSTEPKQVKLAFYPAHSKLTKNYHPSIEFRAKFVGREVYWDGRNLFAYLYGGVDNYIAVYNGDEGLLRLFMNPGELASDSVYRDYEVLVAAVKAAHEAVLKAL